MLSEDEKSEEGNTFRSGVPQNNVKPGDFEDRQQQKRVEDLESLYGMLPDVEPDIIEIHYDQFEWDPLKTFNFLSRGLHQYGKVIPQPIIIVDRGGLFPMIPTNGDDEIRLNDIVFSGPTLRDRDDIEVEHSNLPREEREMIKQALNNEKKTKQVEKAKKKGWCWFA